MRGLPKLCWESKRSFNLFLTIPVDAAKSEFLAEPGISNPLSVGIHFSKTVGEMSFQTSVDFDTKLCLALFNFNKTMINKTMINKTMINFICSTIKQYDKSDECPLQI